MSKAIKFRTWSL